MNHIGYKGSAPAHHRPAWAARSRAFMGTVSDVAAQHKAGRLRVLATSGAQRARTLPEVPTFRELGYNIEGAGWYAAYAPAKTPKDDRGPARRRHRRSDQVARRAREARGARHGADRATARRNSPRIHKADYDKWGPVIKASGFKPEN